MKNILKRISQLRKEKQLARVLSYKFLVHTRIGRFFSFKTQGMRLGIFPTEMTYEAWKSRGDYRSSDFVFLKKILKPGDFVVDVGANVGMITVQSAKLIGSSGQVVGIEPNPNVFPYCEKNFRLNGLKNVTLIQTALGAEEGEISFNCNPCDDCSRVDEKGGISVPITTLDKIMKAYPDRTINLLKIDVEGYELAALQGAVESLKRTEWLYIEVDAQNYSYYGKRAEDVTDLLDASGFDAFVSDESGNWSQLKGAISRSVNLIGKKRRASSAPNMAAEVSLKAS